jgi:aminoglycoside 3-N-acetyltransferase
MVIWMHLRVYNIKYYIKTRAKHRKNSTMAEGEKKVIDSTAEPQTRANLASDLRNLGIESGMILIVHSSLSSLGWVTGGAVAVIQALIDVVTDEGTLVMPAQTGNYSDPASWRNPPVPAEWCEVIYQAMPAFDPAITPSYKMGAIAETFRKWPGTIRSNHPMASFSAWGYHAQEIVVNHELDNSLGEGSPLARMYELGASILLLGVGYNRNTSFHLAEYRISGAQEVRLGSPIYENGQRVWKWYRDIDLDETIFPTIGSELEQTGQVKIGHVGLAVARLFPQGSAIDFATAWYRRHRK